jgi:glycosyltransferase involved in cell wall biosynthesis
VKIAVWTSWETRCGIASYTASLVEELRRRADVDVVPVPYEDRDPGRMAHTLARLNAADLVHVQHEYTFWGGVVPGASSLPQYYRKLKRPRVVTAHTVFTAGELLGLPAEQRWRQRLAKQLLSSYPPYRRSVEREPFSGADAVIVHTAAGREQLIRRGLPPERVHVLAAGMPASPPEGPLPGEIDATRNRFGLKDRRVLTIFGYVTPNKGYELALDAVASLPPGVKLLIAGGARVESERPYQEALWETIRARGMEGRVALTGYLEEREIAAVMALTDLVLVPHTAANGSYSVMFGLAYGKPVLASDLACFKEIRQQKPCLELFDAGDERMLADRAGFLLASSGTRRRLAEAAREYAAEHTWAAVAARTLAVYEEALRTKQAA